MNLTATPLCCSTETKYVFVSHQCQFYFCEQCKQEAFAVEGPKEEVKAVDIKIELSSEHHWLIV